MATTTTETAKGTVYKNLIDGEWVESKSGQTFENLNPADTREVVGVFQRSGKEDVDQAIEAAKEAGMIVSAVVCIVEREEAHGRHAVETAAAPAPFLRLFTATQVRAEHVRQLESSQH